MYHLSILYLRVYWAWFPLRLCLHVCQQFTIFLVIIMSSCKRADFLDTYTHLVSRVSSKSKVVVWIIFCTLVQDESASSSAGAAAIDQWLAMCLLDMGDPDIILDMRKLMANQVQVSLMPFGYNSVPTWKSLVQLSRVDVIRIICICLLHYHHWATWRKSILPASKIGFPKMNYTSQVWSGSCYSSATQSFHNHSATVHWRIWCELYWCIVDNFAKNTLIWSM